MGSKRDMRRGSQATAVFVIILGTFAIMACIVSLLLYLHYEQALRSLKTQQVTDAGIEPLDPEKTTYTTEEVQTLLLETEEETKSNMLAVIKEKMLSGEGTVEMLKDFYPENIIMLYDNIYYFYEISETLAKHNYLEENFKLNLNNELEYYDNGTLASHKGIDVSKYQGEIDWAQVKSAGVEYAFLRLGIRGYESGALVLDETYLANVEGANLNGIQVGVYFFTQAVNTTEAVEEAQFVLDNIASDQVNYPIVFDIEDVGGETARTADLTVEERTAITIAFCETIKEAGFTPMIYGNTHTFLQMLDMEQLENYEKWFAYYDTPVYFPYQFSIWQYSDVGTMPGIQGGVDINISFKEW